MLPFISCVCPTYKRPDLLRNALACFLAQDYPKDRCELIILDDANQFNESTEDNWSLVSTDARYSSLPEKFNALVAMTKGELIAVWEDDDIFLPWNLRDVADCHLRDNSGYYTSEKVWSTFKQKFGGAELEGATGRFHSSWRFTRELLDEIGGYPTTERLSFDQMLGKKLQQGSGGASLYGEPQNPSYVYRWGNGYWHGSQKGDGEGYASLWDYVGSLDAPHQGTLTPAFDLETIKIFKRLNN